MDLVLIGWIAGGSLALFLWLLVGGVVAGIAETEVRYNTGYEWYWAWPLWPLVYGAVLQDRARRAAERRVELEKAEHQAAKKAREAVAARAAEVQAEIDGVGVK